MLSTLRDSIVSDLLEVKTPSVQGRCAYSNFKMRRQSAKSSIVFLVLLFVSTLQAGAGSRVKRSTWCAENFAWEKEKNGEIIKLVEDCDILKDQIPVYISRVVENTECIEWLDLSINAEEMPRRQTWNGKRKSVVTFENSLQDREVYRQYGLVSVTVSAKVSWLRGHFQTLFYVDPSGCPKNGDNIKNEEDKETANPSTVSTNDDDKRSNESENESSTGFGEDEETKKTREDVNPIVFYILVSIPGVFFLVGFIYMCRTLCLPALKEKCCIELEKKDDNPDYGTYYYSDGDRRQDIMEVALKIITIKSPTESI